MIEVFEYEVIPMPLLSEIGVLATLEYVVLVRGLTFSTDNCPLITLVDLFNAPDLTSASLTWFALLPKINSLIFNFTLV